jgi:hypothetical protein
MNPIKFKDFKRIVNELEGAMGVTDDTIVLVPTTKLLDQMKPLHTIGSNMEVYHKDGYYTVASSSENYGTKQMAIILC